MVKFLESKKPEQVQFKNRTGTISELDRADGLFKGKPRSCCLPQKYAKENLFLYRRQAAIASFAYQNTDWHQGQDGKPSIHLCDSLIAYINFSFPFTDKPGKLENLLKLVFPQIDHMTPVKILVVITLIHVWMLIVNATRSTVEIQQGISLLPSKYLVSNYKILLSKGLDLPRGFLNSVTIAVLTTVIAVYFAMLTAYGIVGYNFKGKKSLYNMIIVLVMIPMQLSIIGFYQWMSKLGLTDSYASLILPSIASAGTVFFAKQYLDSIMIQDLIDAGRIDGASEFGIFHRIMIPLAVPGMFTMGIFAFVAAWNNFFNAFILITSRDKYTLPMLVQTLRGDVYRHEYGAIYLGLAASVVPIIIIYFLFSRYIVNGISMGAVKE